jgi:hypothetical protein
MNYQTLSDFNKPLYGKNASQKYREECHSNTNWRLDLEDHIGKRPAVISERHYEDLKDLDHGEFKNNKFKCKQPHWTKTCL